MNLATQHLAVIANHSTSQLVEALTNAQNLIAAGDPLAFQQITAVQAPVEQGEQPVSEMAQALEEAKQRGYVYDPFSLEDDVYGPEEIQAFLDGTASGVPGNIFHNERQ